MRIIVCVKQIYDPATVKISRSREDFDLRQAVKRINPVDRHALEAALRLREVAGGEVIAVTVGDAGAEDVVREAVAMGADRGVLLAGTELAAAGGRGVVAAMLAALERLAPVDLVLTGSADPVTGTGSLAARLGAALAWPVVLDAQCVEPDGAGALQALVPDAGGAHTVPLAGPAITAIAPGPERPRYPHARRIANAYKPGLVDVWPAHDLGIDDAVLAPDTEAGNLVLGPERTRGQIAGGSLADAAGTILEVLRTQHLV
jgi:electron transfer flavoprotein beta subunit